MYYAYVLKSELDNRLYKGLTNNLERRIYEHNQGKHKSTNTDLGNWYTSRSFRQWQKPGKGSYILKVEQEGNS